MSKVRDLTRDLKEMMDLAAKEDGLAGLLHFGLDWVKRLAPFDLTSIFLIEGDRLVVRAARGRLADQTVLNHSLDLNNFPTVRRIIESQRARAFLEEDHAHGDGDPFDGVIDFPHGHACMVVPLTVGNQDLGIMTLDREYCEPYDQETVDLLEIYGRILGMAIHLTEQNERLRRLHDDARERERLLDHELRGDTSETPDTSASPAMRELLRRAQQVARTHTPILIMGETGTGKERLATAIHRWSPREDAPFLKINCAAIPENLLESELFGHTKGAFTGAVKKRPGRFQIANGGTILLDEIGEMPLALQAKLLRVLQEGTFEPVGSDESMKVDVRIFAATHVDLPRAIKDGRFREDLYYRLSVFPLTVPPLRKRLEDLPRLCEALLADLAERTGRVGRYVTGEGMTKLAGYHWPGNVRELANVLERAAILSEGAALGPDSLHLQAGSLQPEEAQAQSIAPAQEEAIITLDDVQRQHIAKVLRRVEGKIYGDDGAAALLGMKPSTLQSRMKKLGVKREVTVAVDA